MSTDTPVSSEPNQPVAPRWRRLRFVAIWLAFFVLLFHIAGGWYFANQIRSDALDIDQSPAHLTYDVRIVASGPDQVEYATDEGANPHLTSRGIYGMAWEPDGFAMVGDIESSTPGTATRAVLPGFAAPPADTLADLLGSVYPGDPTTALDLPFDSVVIATELGEMDAWHVPGDGDHWALFVHGKGTPRTEALRLIPVIADLGLDSLVITYRNDPGAPADPSGFHRYGTTEWVDLEAAVRLALDRGATQVTLVGYSMGGAIVAGFLLESPLAASVDRVVLDAPMLDLGETVRAAAERESLPLGLPVPGTLVASAMLLADWRFDLDWQAVDYVDRAAGFETPMLVIHGIDDDRIPIEISRALADARPDLVELVEFPSAGHVLSWNVDPDRYEAGVRAFLAEG